MEIQCQQCEANYNEGLEVGRAIAVQMFNDGVLEGDVLQGIVVWNQERNNLVFDGINELKMLVEELEEFEQALGSLTEEPNEHEQVDALFDLIVIAVGALHKKGYLPRAVVKEGLKEISSRRQSPSQQALWEQGGKVGKWQKDQNQDPVTLYKADYSKARYE